MLNYSTPYLMTPSSPFQLDYTLKCGQLFGVREAGTGYLVGIGQTPVYIAVFGHQLAIESPSISPPDVPHFFRFDDPVQSLISLWQNDPILTDALFTFRGLRLIRQDPWQCLAGFILSSVSNIPKIETTLERLALYSRSTLTFRDATIPRFPSPSELAKMRETTLRSFGMGFRARYLRAVAKELSTGFPLDLLRTVCYEEAKDALTALPGIGGKVADCILLFSLDHLEAFPVDVWMHRIIQTFYFKGHEKSIAYCSAWGRERFGPMAGYAQQYLYTYGRWKLDPQSPFRKGSLAQALLTNFPTKSRSASCI